MKFGTLRIDSNNNISMYITVHKCKQNYMEKQIFEHFEDKNNHELF